MPIISQFGGIVPRKPAHQLGESEATIAHNVCLQNGRLEAWREREQIKKAVDNANSMYLHGCCFFSWQECVTATDYIVDWGRLYLTGRSDRPETMELNGCDATYYYLGVPQPQSPVTVTATEQYGRDCAQRTYIYTYVNKFGEESSPSPPSTELTIKDGDSVYLSNFTLPPEGYGITEIWIYRSATAYRDETVKEEDPSLTDYLKVGELVLPETTFNDTLWDKQLGSVCETREVRVPPSDLREIRHLKGHGILTGVGKNTIHFSAPYQPHNWPAENDLTLPYDIVHAVTLDDKLFVSTNSYPYVIDAANQCEPRKCKNVIDVDTPLPDIACGYQNSAISTPFGMLYVSKDGLVLVQANGQFQIVSRQWFSSLDWRKTRPESARLAYWRGYVVYVTDVVSLLMEIDADTYGDVRVGTLSTIDDKPITMSISTNGELIMLDKDGYFYQWNTGKTYREFHWESRELSFGHTLAPVAAKIRSMGSVKFRLYTPLQDLYFEKVVALERPFRVRRMGRHLFYRVCLRGINSVDYVELSTAFFSINQGK